MGFDEFFTNGDKPYAENLNDSLLLLDAFNVTVPVSLPDMFSNGEFNSSLNVPRKAGVSIVTLKSVDSGVTIGSDEISGTGDVVFRVYPNFNSFYKWQSISFEKSGIVDVSFKKTDGSLINASVNDNGIISDSSVLKVLQEIDVVLSLSDATVSNVLINFVNNQNNRTRTGAVLEASQIHNLIDVVYPVGSIYMSVNTVSPSVLFGFGVWEKIEDKFLLGSGTTYANGSTGGSADSVVVSHNHTQNSHTHNALSNRRFVVVGDGANWGYSGKIKIRTDGSGTAYYYPHSTTDAGGIMEHTETAEASPTINSTGEDGTGKNMPPYLVVNIWKRTA